MKNAPYYKKALKWANNPYFDKEDRQEIQDLLNNENSQELEERFYQDLEFGTGGLRNIIGFGSNRINKYTIRKTAQAMANTIKEFFPPEKRLVCIGFDSRKLSDQLALEAAKVFASNHIKVKLFNRLLPVPVLSYSIKYFKACAGVMITASHNPREYNGFKAYWSDASQVTPPIDQKIIQAYKDITEWEQISYDQGQTHHIEYCGDEVLTAYTNMLYNHLCDPSNLEQNGHLLKIIYTPLHGTGFEPITKITKKFGLTHLETVKEQAKPHSDFPTVDVPNPEYPAALKMATDLMVEKQADIALGSDPDTDRLGVAYLDEKKQVKFLTGNQIGALILEYKLSTLQKLHKLPSDGLVIKTIVTTSLQEKIAQNYGVKIINTLTGFKWMGKKMRQMKQAGENFTLLFANEESYGYLGHDTIGDKDGINALILLCECALFHKQHGRTLDQALGELYKKYGHFEESLLCLHYPGREGKKIMNTIMEKFRSPSMTHLNDFEIKEKIDLLDHPDFPSSNVLGFSFSNGHKLFMRPSGTEPKIKFYTMYIDTQEINQDKASHFIRKVEDSLKNLSKEIS